MITPRPNDVTQLLLKWREGDRAAFNRLISLVYPELRRIAARYMRRERPDHTLQGSALVNEAYLRLVGAQDVPWENREHFFAIAARLMRQILVDHARGRLNAKRGGGIKKVSLDEAVALQAGDAEIVALHDALGDLEDIAPQLSNLVELRFFGGYTIEETAKILGVGHATVERDWPIAKAWLHRQMRNVVSGEGDNDA